MAEIKLTVNGTAYTLTQSITLADFMNDLSVSTAGLIVDYNGRLYKNKFDTIILQSGDIIELIHFMGGG